MFLRVITYFFQEKIDLVHDEKNMTCLYWCFKISYEEYGKKYQTKLSQKVLNRPTMASNQLILNN